MQLLNFKATLHLIFVELFFNFNFPPGKTKLKTTVFEIVAAV